MHVIIDLAYKTRPILQMILIQHCFNDGSSNPKSEDCEVSRFVSESVLTPWVLLPHLRVRQRNTNGFQVADLLRFPLMSTTVSPKRHPLGEEYCLMVYIIVHDTLNVSGFVEPNTFLRATAISSDGRKMEK